MKIYITAFILPFVTFACFVNGKQAQVKHSLNPKFGDYWYQGKAELSSYDLSQSRYGEIRNGHAVLIFVTEDFSKSKQVKLESPIKNEDDVVKVMKLNATRKFNTGIYPYSTISSVFTPIYLNSYPKTLKLATSSQEWCGHTFIQANLKNNIYEIQGNSYFESEGDFSYQVNEVMMEDEIWNRIRLNPQQLPIGKSEMLPGSLYCRFKHIEFKPTTVDAKLVSVSDSTMAYELNYTEIDRSLKIMFNKSFPYDIQGWEETYTDGFSENAKPMTTKSTVKKVIQLDYWTKNKTSDNHWREELGLE